MRQQHRSNGVKVKSGAHSRTVRWNVSWASLSTTKKMDDYSQRDRIAQLERELDFANRMLEFVSASFTAEEWQRMLMEVSHEQGQPYQASG